MLSILAQERLLGAALGSVFAGVVVYEQRRAIYDSIAANSPSQSQVNKPLFGKRSRQQLAHYWNKAVDQTLGPVIASLSSRGW